MTELVQLVDSSHDEALQTSLDAESEIAAILGGMALLQALPQDLLALESDAEILLSLKESARILFDLNKVALLFSNPSEGKLPGKTFGGLPCIPMIAPLYALGVMVYGLGTKQFECLARRQPWLLTVSARSLNSAALTGTTGIEAQ